MRTTARISIYFRYAAAALITLLCAAVLCVLSSDSIHGRRPFHTVISVSGREVILYEDLERNPFDQEAFVPVDGRMTYLSAPYRIGVDVSSHQGKVNWKKVAGDGISFAMLRCGVRGYGSAGVLKEDERFAYNAKKAAAAGLDIGVYLFSQATSVEEAEEEARFVLDLVKGVPLTLPIVFDWETIPASDSGEDGARTDGMEMDLVTDCALAFCRVIEEAGCSPMVYFNTETGYFLYDIRRIQEEGLPVWFASYHTDWPDFYYHVDWWQYTDSGTVNGIEGPTDLNIIPVQQDPADAGDPADGSSSWHS